MLCEPQPRLWLALRSTLQGARLAQRQGRREQGAIGPAGGRRAAHVVQCCLPGRAHASLAAPTINFLRFLHLAPSCLPSSSTPIYVAQV
jgi:hypothetical protein